MATEGHTSRADRISPGRQRAPADRVWQVPGGGVSVELARAGRL